jgi:hypothetical protein
VYRFLVRASDAAGNTSASAPADYRLLAAAGPAVPPRQSTPAAPDAGSAPATPGTASSPAASPAATPQRRPGPGGAGEREATAPAAAAPAGAAGRKRERPAAREAAPRAATPPAAARPRPKRRRSWTGRTADKVLDTLTEGVTRTVEAVAENADKSVFPMSLLLLVGGFLVLQGRIDGRDPKLALAPTAADTTVAFGPPVTQRRPVENGGDAPITRGGP